MQHRILINEYSSTVGVVLGKAKISRGGTMYLSKITRTAIEKCSEQENDNIISDMKTIYLGNNRTLRLATKNTYDFYTKELAEQLDTTTMEGRQLFRFFTAKSTNYDQDIDKMKIHGAFLNYINLSFDEGDNKSANVIICHSTTPDGIPKRIYSIVNPANLNRLILLSASLMSNTGRKLIKDAINLLDKKTTDKKIVIFFNRKSDSDKEYEKAFVKGCEYLGFSKDNIILSDDITDDGELRNVIKEIDYIYMPDGNVYDTLSYLNNRNLCEVIQDSVTKENRAVYIGSSAGAAVAGVDINLIDYGEFDKNEIGLSPENYKGLGLFGGTIIPHYDQDEYLQRLKECAIKDGKEEMLSNYTSIQRVGNEETLIL